VADSGKDGGRGRWTRLRVVPPAAEDPRESLPPLDPYLPHLLRAQYADLRPRYPDDQFMFSDGETVILFDEDGEVAARVLGVSPSPGRMIRLTVSESYRVAESGRTIRIVEF
jgi:hypothetical protein